MNTNDDIIAWQLVIWYWGGGTKASFVNFFVRDISDFTKYLLDHLKHIYIWQVSPQQGCGDTCYI